jgi:hypothetical protein
MRQKARRAVGLWRALLAFWLVLLVTGFPLLALIVGFVAYAGFHDRRVVGRRAN